MTTLSSFPHNYELPVWPTPSSDNCEDLFPLEPFDFGLNDFDIRRILDPSSVISLESFPLFRPETPEPSLLQKISTPEDVSLNSMQTLGQLEKTFTAETMILNRLPTPEPDPVSVNFSYQPGVLQTTITTESTPLYDAPTSNSSYLYNQPTLIPSPLHRASTPETSPLDSIPTPEPSPSPNKPIPEALCNTPAPLCNPMYSFPTPESSPVERIPPPPPPGTSPLQMFEIKPEACRDTANSPSKFGQVVLNPEKKEVSMDCEGKETSFLRSVKTEEKQQDFPDRETLANNEIKAEKTEQFSNDAEDSSNSDRPVRQCQSRYSFRSKRGGSLLTQSRPTVRKTVVLWKFIKELLEKNDPCVSWISREEGTFKFVDSKQAARLWGQRKNKRNMTYEKMSRALRYYYDRQIMFHDEGQKLMYRFGDGAREDRGQSEPDES